MDVHSQTVNDTIRASVGMATPDVSPNGNTPAPVPQPSQQPNPQQQAAPVPQAPTNDELTGLKESIAAMQKQLEVSQSASTQSAETIRNLEGELFSIKNEKEEKALELPSSEELDSLSRSDAITRVAEAIAEQKMRARDKQYMDAFQRMATDVVGLKNASEESDVRNRYPGFDLDKHRMEINQKRIAYPQMSTSELVQLIADPRELIAANSDRTVQTQDGVHMESGLGNSVGNNAQPDQQQSAAREKALKDGFTAARAAGNRSQADAYLQEIIKSRPDVPANRVAGG